MDCQCSEPSFLASKVCVMAVDKSQFRYFASTAAKSPVYFFCALLGGMALAFLAYAGYHHQTTPGGFACFALIACFFLLIAIITFMDSSDVALSDDGLARNILGRICMRLPWRQVKLIRESFRELRDGEEIVIQVFPTNAVG
jgi:uncharacterized membrane protein YsdA (DUF1294 family)